MDSEPSTSFSQLTPVVEGSLDVDTIIDDASCSKFGDTCPKQILITKEIVIVEADILALTSRLKSGILSEPSSKL